LTAWLPPCSPPTLAPIVLPVMRLRLRTNSLCRTCFFALINTSLPRPALFVPAYERLVAVVILDRTRGARAAPPLARGIFEPAVATAAARNDGKVAEEDVVAAAARCVPSLAMIREREMRGFRSCPFVVVDVGARPALNAGGIADDEVAGGRSGLCVPLRVAAASAVAAAAREVGFVGGGMTAWFGDSNSGVVNILSPRGEPGLFVMASRTALRGGVLARCATMMLVLDLAGAAGPRASAPGLRIFARELAVGANNLDVALVGLKIDALLLLLALALVPGARPVDVEGCEAPTLSLMPADGLALTEPARTL
jgi:hypothetical protein